MCRFLSHARTAGNVVGTIAHQSQHINDLCGRLDIEFCLYFFYAHHLKAACMLGAVHEDISAYQLTVVFVRGHHISSDALFAGFGGQGADHVVGLVSRYFQNRNAVGPDNFLYNGYGQTDYLGRFFALRLVLFIRLVPEGGAGGVECHTDVRRIFFLQHLFQRIDKSQHG